MTFDVVVIGAGPAGALAARETSRHGLSTLLVDKASFPRFKVCGCCLNDQASALLGRVGLGSLPIDSGGIALEKLSLFQDERRVDLPISGGVSLSRETLDHLLVEKAKEAGATFRSSCRAEILSRDPGEDRHRAIGLHVGKEETKVRASIVLVADGLGGATLSNLDEVEVRVNSQSRIGAGIVTEISAGEIEKGQIFMACGADGYVGAVRLEEKVAGRPRIALAAALDRDAVRRVGSPGRLGSRILEASGFSGATDLSELNWIGTPTLTRGPGHPGAHRILAFGDAAGYVEPFTGQGMEWAMTSAVEVASFAREIIARGGGWNGLEVREWESRLKKTVRRRQVLCRGVSKLLRSPRLLRGAIQILSLGRGQFSWSRPILGLVGWQGNLPGKKRN